VRRGLCILALGVAAAVSAARCQTNDRDRKELLAGVTERGRELYDYDQCAWHGTDAILAMHPDMSGVAHYLCVNTPTGWRLVFPRWNATHDGLMVAFEADGSGKNYDARAFDSPVDAGDDLMARERALELALKSFHPAHRAYNTAILDAPNGDFYVYVYPGQTKDTVWPLGGDVRYTIRGDGKKIVETRPLHKTILDMEYDPGDTPTSGFHMHVLSDVPEDTDVLYVLNRRPLIPEYIGTLSGWIFVIHTDGTIESTPPCAKGNPLPCKKR
jgi:hypothetical protein